MTDVAVHVVGKKLSVSCLLALALLCSCSTPEGREERGTSSTGRPPSGESERELIEEALDEEVSIPEANVDVDIDEEIRE